MRGENILIHIKQINMFRSLSCQPLIVKWQPLIEQRFSDSAIGQTRIKMRNSVMDSNAAGKSTFARRRWSIYGDDKVFHSASLCSIFAPSPAIISMNSGKDVAMIL